MKVPEIFLATFINLKDVAVSAGFTPIVWSKNSLISLRAKGAINTTVTHSQHTHFLTVTTITLTYFYMNTDTDEYFFCTTFP